MPLKPEIKILALEMVRAWRSDSGLALSQNLERQVVGSSGGSTCRWVSILMFIRDSILSAVDGYF